MKFKQKYVSVIFCTYGIILNYNAEGDLKDSYRITNNQLNDAFACLSASFLDDGSYVASWISTNQEKGFAVSPTSFQYIKLKISYTRL